MKKVFLLLVPSIVLAARPALPAPPTLSAPPGLSFRPLRPGVHDLPSGMKVFVLEDRTLPIVNLALYLKGGSVRDPKGREGLASLALQGIRFGGSRVRRPETVEETLEFVGGSLEVAVFPEFSTLSLAVLKKDLATGLDLLFDLLQEPAFDPRQVDILRKKSIEAVIREAEDPLRLGMREFPKRVYGEDSVWGRAPSARSLKRISRNDLAKYHRRFVAPNRMVIAASGDLTDLELIREIKIRTAGWGPAEESLLDLPAFERGFRPGLFFLPRKGLTQSTILIGHLGAKRDNPDKFALIAMNYILGGSGALTSRLGEEVRTQSGQAYSVWSHFGFGKEEGVFYAAAQTASASTTTVIGQMQKILSQMAVRPEISEAEIYRTKKVLKNSLFFDYETRFALVRDFAKFHLWGYPDDYLEIYQKEVAGLDRDAVQRVAGQYLHPEGWKILVVGPPEIEKQLRSFGPFEKI